MSTASEIPAITDFAASGTGVFFVHVIRDASGQVMSGTVDYTVNYTLASAATFTGLHFHTGGAAVNGPVVINTGLAGGAASVASDPSGKGVIKRQAEIRSDDAAGLTALRGLLNSPGDYYANLHTTVYPGGLIRGQLRRAEWTVLLGTMSATNEVPAIPGIDASAFATVTAVRAFDPNGVMAAGMVTFDVDYSKMPQKQITGMHIHSSPAGVNGPVTVNTGIAGGARALDPDASGNGNLFYDVEVPPSDAAASATLNGLFDAPSQFYINIHNTDFPGGLVRSQLLTPERVRFNYIMRTSEEVPPITDLTAQGAGLLDIRVLRDGTGSVTAGRVTFDLNHRVTGAVEITGFHIHNAKAGVNGAVTINTGIAGGARSVKSDGGSGNVTRGVSVTGGDALAALNSVLTNPENHYVNMHSTVYPGGFIRAQLGANNERAPAVANVISAVSDPMLKTVAPGGLMTIFGSDLQKVASDLGGLISAKLPNTVNGTSVTIGGASAPILMLGKVPGLNPADYIVAQVPFETAIGAQKVVVKSANGTSGSFDLTVAKYAPGLYFDAVGGTIAKVSNLSLVSPDNRATPGEPLAIISTGLGQTNPALATGAIPADSRLPLTTAADASVTVGGKDATALGSAAYPGYPGTYITVFQMPTGLASGNQPVVLTIGGVKSNAVTLSAR